MVIFYDSLVSSIFIAALILPPMSAISLLSNNLHCCVLVLETLCNSRQQPVVLLVRPGVVDWIHFSSDFRKQSLEDQPALGNCRSVLPPVWVSFKCDVLTAIKSISFCPGFRSSHMV